ncbi:TRL-like family protein [Leptospira ryugenii]|uniref:TRL-like family protein n=1 Tax=Leptospira ryugenii TaxID=1917863 RepID=A0A2P2DZH0_9LEPT|nr:TRL domain-containing protein [Leptospira ryugenii]GBF50028.1 TRL-like family protein [Leptospira ryugenii]
MKIHCLPILALCFFVNCLSAPMQSLLFTSTSQNVNGDVTGNQITSARILKSGKSCASSGLLINLFYYGSGNSIEEAAKNAGITKIALVDRDSFNVLYNLFYKECVIVWGE